MSKIEWTEKTWNPIVGCSIVSPGCTNCYAMSMAARLEAMSGDGLDDNGYAVRGVGPLDHYRKTTRRVNGKPVWTGKVALAPERILTEPLRRRKPTTYFVNSMGDLFHEDCPDEWIDRVFAVMALCPQHTFQILTKRSARMRAYCASDETFGRVVSLAREWLGPHGTISINYCDDGLRGINLPNVWLGVSAERQPEADARIRDLRATPAAVRFVSGEPLLSPIDFGEHLGCGSNAEHGHPKLDWVIVGGESGPNARPMHPDWARSIRDQCAAAGVPFFFKQWGAWVPDDENAPTDWRARPSGWVCLGVDGLRKDGYAGGREQFMRLEGKARAGRLLDGVLHDAYPSRQQHTEAA